LQDVYAGLRDIHNAGIAHNNLHAVNVFVHSLDTFRIGNFGACSTSNNPDASMLSSTYCLGDYFAHETSYSLDVYTFAQSLLSLMTGGEAKSAEELQYRGYSPELVDIFRALLSPPHVRPNAQAIAEEVGAPTAAEHEVILTYRRQLAYLKRQIVLEKRRITESSTVDIDEEPSSPIVIHGGEREELPSFLRESVRLSMEIPKHHAINTVKDLLCFKMPIETPPVPSALLSSP
jgi:serine/threonine protein kinase